MMKDQLIDAFDACTTSLMEGTSLDDCVARYPEMAEELRSMLLTITSVRNYINSVKVPQQAQAASRSKFLAGSIQANSTEHPGQLRIHNLLSLLTRRVAFGFACILLGFILGTYGVIQASNQSLPGDPLYSVKRTTEKTRLLFSTNSEKHALMEDLISQHRSQEAHEITKQGRVISIEFGGQLESLKGDRGVVDGLQVIITPDTQIIGVPDIGLYVWVIGSSQTNQTVIASTIRVEGIRFRGVVTSMRKMSWQVDDFSILVSKSTQIIGNPKIGDQVNVNARILADRQLLAEEITSIGQETKPTDTPPQNPVVTSTRAPEHTGIAPTSPVPEATPDPESDDDNELLDLESEETEEAPDEPTLQPSEEDEDDDDAGGEEDDGADGECDDDPDDEGDDDPDDEVDDDPDDGVDDDPNG